MKDMRIVCWLNMQILFPLWIPADAAYTEEDEWSDEFDDDDTLGMILFTSKSNKLLNQKQW